MRKLITPLAIAAAILFTSQNISAQNVGINTQQPDPSAALDIVGTDKGLLIPRVSLQSLNDNATIPNPATALLVYNINAAVGKVGFYYNAGTAENPVWAGLVGGELTLPYDKTASHSGPLFGIENSNAAPTSSAITAYSVSAMGLRGITQSGKAINGQALTNGVGVFAAASNTNGTALEVSGPIKIAGPGQSPGSGKVLMSDANGNANWQNISEVIAFRASGVQEGGSEIIPGNGSVTKVAFAAENYDIGNDYNGVDGSPHSTFVTPVTGTYHFDIQLYHVSSIFKETFINTTSLRLTRNGVSTTIVESENTTENYSTTMISTDAFLQQGDLIHVETKGVANNNIIISTSPTKSMFSGRLLFKQ